MGPLPVGERKPRGARGRGTRPRGSFNGAAPRWRAEEGAGIASGNTSTSLLQWGRSPLESGSPRRSSRRPGLDARASMGPLPVGERKRQEQLLRGIGRHRASMGPLPVGERKRPDTRHRAHRLAVASMGPLPVGERKAPRPSSRGEGTSHRFNGAAPRWRAEAGLDLGKAYEEIGLQWGRSPLESGRSGPSRRVGLRSGRFNGAAPRWRAEALSAACCAGVLAELQWGRSPLESGSRQGGQAPSARRPASMGPLPVGERMLPTTSTR